MTSRRRIAAGLAALCLWSVLAVVIQFPAAALFERVLHNSVAASETDFGRGRAGNAADFGHDTALDTESRAAPLNVPIVVHELRPTSELGFDRIEEPVTVGIPLPEDAAVHDVSELVLLGADRYQFRPLGFWESGAIKWVLVDFLATVPAGETLDGMFVTRAEEETSPEPIGLELADSIVIDTGAMRMVLAREGTSLVREVSVDGRSIVNGEDAFSLSALGLDGTEYPATVTDDLRVELVENGPVKAVVRARGAHRSAEGAHLFDFELKLTAFHGKHFVRGEYTLKNGSKRSPKHVRHGGIRLRLETELEGDSLHYRFPTAGDTPQVIGEVASGSTASYFMGYNASKQDGAKNVRRDWPNDGWIPPFAYDFETRRFAQEGFLITEDGATVASGGPDQYTEVTYADAWDPTGLGVSSMIRFASRHWPVSFDVDGDGAVTVGLFSDKQGAVHTVNYYQHETREFALDFQSSAHVGYFRAYYETFPLSARVPDMEYWNRCEVLPDKLVSLEEVNGFFRDYGVDLQLYPNNEAFYTVRFWDAGQGGGNNQLDITYHDLVRFWRTGDSGAFFRAKAWADYRSDWAVIHTDDFVYCTNGDPRFPQHHAQNHGEFLVANGHIFDNQHRHNRGLPLMYYFTGNTRYLDSYLEEIEVVALNDRVSYQYLNTRVQAMLLKDGMQGYRFLQEVAPLVDFAGERGIDREEIYGYFRDYLRKILDARYNMNERCSNVQQKGWSDEPGQAENDARRFWFAGGDREPNREPKFHLFSMFPDALHNYEFFAPEHDPNVHEMRQRILDLEHYFWTALFSSCPDDPTSSSIGSIYVHVFDSECQIPEVPECATGDDFHSPYALEAFAYRLTGDGMYLDHGRSFMLGQHYGSQQLVNFNAYRTDFLDFVYLHRDYIPDTEPPATRALRSTKKGDHPIVIRWETNEPAVGKIVYWTDPSDRRETEIEGDLDDLHAVSMPQLQPLVEYRYRAASRDEAGNWSGSRRKVLGYDDFSRNTLRHYDVVSRHGGSIAYAQDSKTLRFHGSARSTAALTLQRERTAIGGIVSFDFHVGEAYGPEPLLRVALLESANTYYELTAFRRSAEQEPKLRLRKIVDGNVVKIETADRNAFQRDELNLRLKFWRSEIGVEERGTGELFGMHTPRSHDIHVRQVLIDVRQMSGGLDNLIVEFD